MRRVDDTWDTWGAWRTRVLRLARLACAACALVFGVACSAGAGTPPADAPPPPVLPALPPGTVFTVDGHPVTEAEVDRVAGWIALLEPAKVLAERRRIALNELVLPRAVLAAGAPAARARALELAAAEPMDADARPISGSFGALGLGAFGLASELEPGALSEPFEDAGRVLRLALGAVQPSPLPGRTRYDAKLWVWPFVDPAPAPAAMLELAAAARLEIVDPAWSEIVPTEWRYRMRGDPR